MTASTYKLKIATRRPPRLVQRPESQPALEAPKPERIRTRAFEIFLNRQIEGAPGDALSDWLQAEREISGPAFAASGADTLNAEAQL